VSEPAGLLPPKCHIRSIPRHSCLCAPDCPQHIRETYLGVGATNTKEAPSAASTIGLAAFKTFLTIDGGGGAAVRDPGAWYLPSPPLNEGNSMATASTPTKALFDNMSATIVSPGPGP
jgi:hypothetical protein